MDRIAAPDGTRLPRRGGRDLGPRGFGCRRGRARLPGGPLTQDHPRGKSQASTMKSAVATSAGAEYLPPFAGYGVRVTGPGHTPE